MAGKDELMSEVTGSQLRHSPTDLVSKWPAWGPRLQSVLRIVAAFMFMLAGTMKLFAFPAGVPPNGGTVQLMSQMGDGQTLQF